MEFLFQASDEDEKANGRCRELQRPGWTRSQRSIHESANPKRVAWVLQNHQETGRHYKDQSQN